MIADIKGGIDAIRSLIAIFREHSSISEKRKSVAISSLMKAITATRSYIATLEKTGRGDNDEEAKLTILWIEASKAVRPVDNELAERCFMKAYGWADRAHFDDPEFQGLAISLDEMSRSIRNLIRDERLPVTMDSHTKTALSHLG